MSQTTEPLALLTDQSTSKPICDQECPSPTQFSPPLRIQPSVFRDDCMREDIFSQAHKKMGDKIANMLRNERIKASQPEKTNGSKYHECEKCDCEGTTECAKKISFLENKVRYLMDSPYTKEISEIYDIEQMGLQNKSYLVEYTDGTLEKVSVKYIKKHHLESYVQFLQNCCFKSD